MAQYIVLMSHNFDGELDAHTFTNEDKTRAFLEWSYKNYLQEELDCGSGLDMSNCYITDDKEYARVTWYDGCMTEFVATFISGPDEEFEEYWKKLNNRKEGK